MTKRSSALGSSPSTSVVRKHHNVQARHWQVYRLPMSAACLLSSEPVRYSRCLWAPGQSRLAAAHSPAPSPLCPSASPLPSPSSLIPHGRALVLRPRYPPPRPPLYPPPSSPPLPPIALVTFPPPGGATRIFITVCLICIHSSTSWLNQTMPTA